MATDTQGGVPLQRGAAQRRQLRRRRRDDDDGHGHGGRRPGAPRVQQPRRVADAGRRAAAAAQEAPHQGLHGDGRTLLAAQRGRALPPEHGGLPPQGQTHSLFHVDEFGNLQHDYQFFT